MQSRVVIVLACLVAVACGATAELQAGGRIIGGTPAMKGEISYHVAIEYYDPPSQSWKFRCEGAIVSNEFIITAAHCIIEQHEEGRVLAGTLDWEVPGYGTYSVVDFIVDAKDYLALLKVSPPIEYNGEIVWPVILPEPATATDPGTNLTVTGWGEGSESNALMKLDVQSVSDEYCSEIYPNLDLSVFICAGGNSTQTGLCSNKNYGAPLVKKYNQLLGIFYVQYGSCELPGFYVYIPLFRDWIQQITGV